MPAVDRRRLSGGRAWAVTALAVSLGGCGSVGDPLPPLLRIPGSVNDLAASQIAGEIRVEWTWPLLTTEGTLARQIGGFDLWAVDVPGFSSPLAPETIDEYRRHVRTLGPTELAGKEPGNRIVLRTPLADWRLDQLTVLVLTASSPAGRDAGYSNQVRLHPLQPPAEPQWSGLSAVPNGVALFWIASERAEEYAIERAEGEEGEFASLGRLGSESFVDRTIEWGRTYRYRLRPYRLSQAGWITGLPSPARGLTPRDTFPPEAPEGLRAVRTPASIELSWLPNAETDVKGYRVLRDSADLAGLIETASFSDGTAEPDTAYAYAVVAVDEFGNESEPSAALRVAAMPQ